MVFGIKFIQTSTTGIVQTFGRFTRIATPGLNLYIPFVQRISLVSNRLTQSSFSLQVKTKDNVFTHVRLDVQYRVRPDDSYKAHFTLESPSEQINSYVENAVRSTVPKMSLDDLFESQDEISNNVSAILKEKMNQYGYTIENTLITTIEPSEDVKNAMNKINASLRLKHAAQNEADAHYIKEIRQAEADRDRKELQGIGISKQRQAILKGFEDSIESMAKGFNLSPQMILHFVKSIQELDTMESIGRSNNTKVLFFERDKNENLTKDLIKANQSD